MSKKLTNVFPEYMGSVFGNDINKWKSEKIKFGLDLGLSFGINKATDKLKALGYYESITFRYQSAYGRTSFCNILKHLFPAVAKKCVRKTHHGIQQSNLTTPEKDRLALICKGLQIYPIQKHTFLAIIQEKARVNQLSTYIGSDYTLDIDESYGRLDHHDDMIIYLHFFGQKAKEIREKAMKKIDKFLQKDRKDDIVSVLQTQIFSDNINEVSLHAEKMEHLLFDGKERILALLHNFVSASKHIETLGLRSMRGVLLYGPSGTGKTSFVLAYAREQQYPIVQVVCTRAIRTRKNYDDNYYGPTNDESELPNIVNMITGMTMDCQMVIVLFDELDRLVQKTSVDTILNLIDSLPNRVICMATTNHFDELDTSIKRSGRFDYRFELTNFQSETDAKELCRTHGIADITTIQLVLDKSRLEDGSINPAELKTQIVDQLMDDYVGKGNNDEADS